MEANFAGKKKKKKKSPTHPFTRTVGIPAFSLAEISFPRLSVIGNFCWNNFHERRRRRRRQCAFDNRELNEIVRFFFFLFPSNFPRNLSKKVIERFVFLHKRKGEGGRGERWTIEEIEKGKGEKREYDRNDRRRTCVCVCARAIKPRDDETLKSSSRLELRNGVAAWAHLSRNELLQLVLLAFEEIVRSACRARFTRSKPKEFGERTAVHLSIKLLPLRYSNFFYSLLNNHSTNELILLCQTFKSNEWKKRN